MVRELEAVHHRQADIEQPHVGPEGVHQLQRLGAVAGHRRDVPRGGQRRGQHLGGILVVVDDEHALRRRRRRHVRRPARGDPGRLLDRDARDPHHELAALARAAAVRLDRAVVQRDQAADDRQAQPSPPCALSIACRSWVNKSNTRGSISGSMPMPLSRTLSRTCSPSPPALIWISPCGGVYFAALASRLLITCARRAGSAKTPRPVRATDASRRC